MTLINAWGMLIHFGEVAAGAEVYPVPTCLLIAYFRIYKTILKNDFEATDNAYIFAIRLGR